ncbi:MAG TPA: hypothetical protein PK992_07180, partial [Planctomycetaceae bacterium]|nr:hypothetical protein [Planctomycetaceae bacterium]
MSLLTFRRILVWCLWVLCVNLVVSEDRVLAQTPAPSPLQFLEGHAAAVHAVGYSPDGKILFSGDTAGTLKMWDRATGQLLSSGVWHDGAILTLAVSPDGQQVVTAGTGKQIVVSDVAIPGPLLDMTGVPGVPTCVIISSDGATLLTGDESNNVS